MRCPRRRETRAQVASAGMPGSLVFKPGLVNAGHLCPCQAKSPLSSRPSAHATLRRNPPSLFSSVQSPGPPASSRQAWWGAIRAPASLVPVGPARCVRHCPGPAAGRRAGPALRPVSRGEFGSARLPQGLRCGSGSRRLRRQHRRQHRRLPPGSGGERGSAL